MTQPAPLRVADSIAATLAAHGLTAAFGMPGGEVVTLLDALTRAGIGFHLARHETAAAMMAAGHATLSRTPGLLVTTVGPGLANAVNGIADAAQEHVPLIVISGVVDRASRSRYTIRSLITPRFWHLWSRPALRWPPKGLPPPWRARSGWP